MQTQVNDYMQSAYYQMVNKQWTLQYFTDHVWARRSRVWTDTIKRTHPLNGFAYSTSRSVKSEIRQDSGCTWQAVDRNQMWAKHPLLNLFDPTGSIFRDKNRNGEIVPWSPDPQLRAAMYNKIRSDVRGEACNLAVAMAEYRQTAKLFRDLAEVVTSRGRSLLKKHPELRYKRRGRVSVAPGNKSDLSSSASNAWLQFTYGIRPLAQDMYTSVNALRNTMDIAPPVLNGVVRRRDSSAQTGFVRSAYPYMSGAAAVNRTYEVFLRSQYRATLNANAARNTLVQFGMVNPASVVYELVPYSFVIDWWVNVGEVIASLDNLLLLDKLEVIDSTSRRAAHRLIPDSSQFIEKGEAFVYIRTDNRTAAVEIPRIATLLYKPSVSRGHIMNGLALFQQFSTRSRFNPHRI
jgi:hypothetical protein